MTRFKFSRGPDKVYFKSLAFLYSTMSKVTVAKRVWPIFIYILIPESIGNF